MIACKSAIYRNIFSSVKSSAPMDIMDIIVRKHADVRMVELVTQQVENASANQAGVESTVKQDPVQEMIIMALNVL